MNILLTVLLIGLVLVAVWLLKSGMVRGAGSGVAVGLAAVGIAVVIWGISAGGKSHTEAILATYEQYQAACGKVFGDTLAARHPEARVVMLTLPSAREPGTEALLDHLQDALEQGGLTVKRKPIQIPDELKAQLASLDDSSLTPELIKANQDMLLKEAGMWFTPAALNDVLIELENEADLVINTFDFIFELDPASIIPKGRGPALAMINVHLENAASMFEQTVLDATVRYHKSTASWNPEAEVPKDIQEAFDQRYVIATADEP